MYLKLKSGRTCVVGRWPTVDESKEIEELLAPRELSLDDKVVAILDGERPATYEDIQELKTKILALLPKRQKRTLTKG